MINLNFNQPQIQSNSTSINLNLNQMTSTSQFDKKFLTSERENPKEEHFHQGFWSYDRVPLNMKPKRTKIHRNGPFNHDYQGARYSKKGSHYPYQKGDRLNSTTTDFSQAIPCFSPNVEYIPLMCTSSTGTYNAQEIKKTYTSTIFIQRQARKQWV